MLVASGTTIGRFTNTTAPAVTQPVNGSFTLDMEKCQVVVTLMIGGIRTGTYKGTCVFI